jgi:predicted secreted hydrolase
VNPVRRQLLGLAGALPFAAAGPARAATQAPFAAASHEALVFARDFGAHPDMRIEWWYLTGHLDAPLPGAEAGAGAVAGASALDPGTATLGVQLTFFRIATGIGADNPSRFAARQLVLGHAALADARRGALLHDERLARTGFGVAQAATGDTHVGVDGWRLDRDPASGRYTAVVAAADYRLSITASPTQPLLLQGDKGYSLKGRDPAGRPAASSYYTEPQLQLQARLAIDGRVEQRRGRGWLDHEWSSALLPPAAAGWDWGGFNLDDGSALTFFRIRARSDDGGGQALHAYASLRSAGGAMQQFAPGQISFTPLQYWTSPRTRARYPVSQGIRIGGRAFETRPLMPDQEFDARASSGLSYWEGASTLFENGQSVGNGYLELTGYAGAAPSGLFGG